MATQCTVHQVGSQAARAVYEVQDDRPRLVMSGGQYLDAINRVFPRAIALAEHHRSLGLTPSDILVEGYRFSFDA